MSDEHLSRGLRALNSGAIVELHDDDFRKLWKTVLYERIRRLRLHAVLPVHSVRVEARGLSEQSFPAFVHFKRAHLEMTSLVDGIALLIVDPYCQ